MKNTVVKVVSVLLGVLVIAAVIFGGAYDFKNSNNVKVRDAYNVAVLAQTPPPPDWVFADVASRSVWQVWAKRDSRLQAGELVDPAITLAPGQYIVGENRKNVAMHVGKDIKIVSCNLSLPQVSGFRIKMFAAQVGLQATEYGGAPVPPIIKVSTGMEVSVLPK